MKVAGLSKLEDGTHCDEARVLAEQKLCNVRAKLADLQRMVIVLQQPVEQRLKLSGTVRCPLIVALRTAGRIVGSYL